MKISIVSCVFPPEPIVSARTSKDLAEALVDQGHSVLVITTFPNRPSGKLYSGYQRKLWAREWASGGYDVVRILSFFSPYSNMLGRFFENLTFGFASGLAIFLLDKPDVVYGNTWPIFAQGLLALACKLRRIHLVLSIQDLYPESLFVQNRGVGKTSHLYTFLHWLDTQVARSCSRLIVISKQFKEIYMDDRRVPQDKISVIPNWIEISPQAETLESEVVRKKHNIPLDAFLVVYGGNIGVAAGVEHVVDAFQYLVSQDNIYLMLAGAGNNLTTCLDQIQKYQINRAKIHSPWLSTETFAVLKSADLCILPTYGEQSLISVPSKLLSYMAAGRCVLAMVAPESETARIISEAEAGWIISSNDSRSLANRITEISKLSSSERIFRGQSGLEYVKENFSTSVVLPRLIDLLVYQGEKE